MNRTQIAALALILASPAALAENLANTLDVFVFPTEQGVTSGFAEKFVYARTAEERVIATTTDQGVMAVTTT